MNRFRKLRLDNNYSQTQLAKKLKVHQTAISQWELGKSFPDILTMQKLADIYDVSIDYILGRENSRNGHVALPEDEERLLQNYRSLGTEEKNTVQDFIENKNRNLACTKFLLRLPEVGPLQSNFPKKRWKPFATL